MITAEAHTEPARHQRRANPRTQLARYLMQNAGPVPHAAPSTLPSRALAGQARQGDMAPVDRRALAKMQQAWQAARGYFPGREMPVPHFDAKDVSGAQGWADGRPVGITWDRYSSQALTSSEPLDRDTALQNLLHEWAHNFQKPDLHTGQTRRMPSGDMVHPRAEGGAQAFAMAVAPRIAAMLGQGYDRRDAARQMRLDPYRPFVMRAATRKGMPWILRGQFGDA